FGRGVMSGMPKIPERVGTLDIYQTLLDINRCYERILEGLNTLRLNPLFRNTGGRAFLRAFEVSVRENRAWLNAEILEPLADVELQEWARFGNRRRILIDWAVRRVDTPPESKESQLEHDLRLSVEQAQAKRDQREPQPS